MTGIEPAPSAWKAEALPLSYIRTHPKVTRHNSTACTGLKSTRSLCNLPPLSPASCLRAGVALALRGTKLLMWLRRGVAQLGSAPALGAGGRRFKSCHPDHFLSPIKRRIRCEYGAFSLPILGHPATGQPEVFSAAPHSCLTKRECLGKWARWIGEAWAVPASPRQAGNGSSPLPQLRSPGYSHGYMCAALEDT